MNASFFIAKRYLLSKRKTNFISIISWLAVTAVAIITASLIVVMSVFNGLEDLLFSLNNTFDAPLLVKPTKGKSFVVTDSLLNTIEQTEGVAIVTEVIEDYAYLRYRQANQLVTIKGVSNNFLDHKRIDKAINNGKLRLTEDNSNFAIIGAGIEYNLSVMIDEPYFPMQLYYIKKSNTSGSIDPSQLYSQVNVVPTASFSIVQQYDDHYVIVPLRVAEQLMDYKNRRTAIEIKAKESYSVTQVQNALQKKLGERFLVLNHQQQHADLYKLLKMEKLFVFMAFAILLGIGALNIFFGLMMLTLDKKKDLSILVSMGASEKFIQRIFLLEGILIAGIGTTIGLALGGLICWLQMNFKLISMGVNNAVTEGYPIKPMASDFLLALVLVACITFLVSIKPALLAAKNAKVDYL
ncbi:MAG: ABC transporter permease [Cyclobacteriaceae bacterium]|nr:ABC transporter permease [Cyclobacteriaceae bacterium]